jgi:serine/threonine-protein kinase
MKSAPATEDPVLEEVGRILASREFSRSERLGSFLRFVVQQKLEGKADEIKETVIGIEVFGRKPDYDPRIDPVVRMEAARLRARLAEYYAGAGSNDPIRIEVPKGAYVPQWQTRSQARHMPRWKLAAAIAVSLALVLAGIAVWQISKPAQNVSIAVLPFLNVSSDPENEYFSDGLTEEIIHLLSLVEGLEVTSRTSSFALKGERLDSREIGSKLNVTVLLEGSVRKAGDQLRVTAQLIRADSGKDLWSNTYDRRMQDVFAIQREIASSIATALRLNLGTGRRRYTDNLEAYESYLRGRYALEHRSAGEALRHFDNAIAKDSQFALAYAGIADAGGPDEAGGALFNLGEIEGRHDRARAAAEKAVELDPGLSEAQSALGTVVAHEYAWREAEAIFRKAIELNPNNSVAHWQFGFTLLVPSERFDEGLAEIRRARELDPLSPAPSITLAYMLLLGRRYGEAIEEARKSIALQRRPEPYQFWGRALYLQGRNAEALDIMREADRLQRNVSTGWLACASVRAGLRDQALQILQDTLQGGHGTAPSRRFVQIYSCLGDTEKTFEYLQKMHAEHDAGLPLYALYPELDFIRADARFAALRQKMGLAP